MCTSGVGEAGIRGGEVSVDTVRTCLCESDRRERARNKQCKERDREKSGENGHFEGDVVCAGRLSCGPSLDTGAPGSTRA